MDFKSFTELHKVGLSHEGTIANLKQQNAELRAENERLRTNIKVACHIQKETSESQLMTQVERDAALEMLRKCVEALKDYQLMMTSQGFIPNKLGEEVLTEAKKFLEGVGK